MSEIKIEVLSDVEESLTGVEEDNMFDRIVRGEKDAERRVERMNENTWPLSAGITTETDKSSNRYQCPTCSRSYKNKCHLHRHIKSECGRNRFCCSRCNSSFKRKPDLEEHFKASCGKEPQFACPNCGKTYINDRNMKKHLNSECGKARQFRCALCPFRSHWKWNLTTHMKRHEP